MVALLAWIAGIQSVELLARRFLKTLRESYILIDTVECAMKKLSSRELKNVIGSILKEELQKSNSRRKSLKEAPETVEPGDLYKSDEYKGKKPPAVEQPVNTLNVEEFVKSIEDTIYDELLGATDGFVGKIFNTTYKVAARSLFHQGLQAHHKSVHALVNDLTDMEAEVLELQDNASDSQMDFESEIRHLAFEFALQSLKPVLNFYKSYVLESQ